MPKVFIPHVPHRMSPVHRTYVPSLDISQLTRFGELRECVSQRVRSRDIDYEAALKELQVTMADYHDDDYVACAGDPVLIGMVYAIACRKGPVNILRYDKQASKYIQTQAPGQVQS